MAEALASFDPLQSPPPEDAALMSEGLALDLGGGIPPALTPADVAALRLVGARPPAPVAPAVIAPPMFDATALPSLGRAPLPDDSRGVVGVESGDAGGFSPPPIETSIEGAVPASTMLALSAQQNAGMQLADVQARKADAEAKVIQRRAEVVAKVQAEHAAAQAEAKAEGQALFDDVVSGRLDASRFWRGMDTGSRATALAGLVLGGLGGALTGHGNPAMDTLDRLIDRDIDEQKANLEARRGVYSMYLQKTRDEEAAAGLAKADMLDAFAAQLTAKGSEFNSELARAEGMKMAADLQVGAERIRQQALQDSFGRELSVQRLQLDKEEQAARLGLAYGKATGNATADAARDRVYEALDRGQAIPAAALRLLPEAEQKRQVPVPGGGYRLAPSDVAATDFREVMQGIGKIRAIAADMRVLRKEVAGHPSNPFGSAASRSEALVGLADLAMKSAEKGGTWDNGLKILLAPIIPNPMGVHVPEANFEKTVVAWEKYASDVEKEATRYLTTGGNDEPQAASPPRPSVVDGYQVAGE